MKKARCRLAVDLNEFDGASRAHDTTVPGLAHLLPPSADLATAVIALALAVLVMFSHRVGGRVLSVHFAVM